MLQCHPELTISTMLPCHLVIIVLAKPGCQLGENANLRNVRNFLQCWEKLKTNSVFLESAA